MTREYRGITPYSAGQPQIIRNRIDQAEVSTIGTHGV
jgi:hypothetical protein